MDEVHHQLQLLLVGDLDDFVAHLLDEVEGFLVFFDQLVFGGGGVAFVEVDDTAVGLFRDLRVFEVQHYHCFGVHDVNEGIQM
jgi:hypothetical protein